MKKEQGKQSLPFLVCFSRFTQILILALFGLVGILTLFHGLFFPTQYTTATYFALVYVFLGVIVLWLFYLHWGKWSSFLENSRLAAPLPEKAASHIVFALLLSLCFLIRLLWVLSFQIQPQVDYYTFYHAAESLEAGFDISAVNDYLPRYMALFPHIFGYASFLSLIFSLFGPSPMAAAVTNALLSTLSMAFLYFISNKLAGRSLAVVASLIWCFFPSLILFNVFVLSEPYYTTLLLASMALIVCLHDHLQKWNVWKCCLLGFPLGLLLSLVNSARPISAIMIIALVVVLFVIEPISKNGHIGKKVGMLLCLCLMYFLGNLGNDLLFTMRVGEAPASLPGYSIYVGFNEESSGKWSQHDSDVLDKYNRIPGMTAQDVQEAMMDEAIQRITSGDIHFPKLFYEKNLVLWQKDDAAVASGENFLPHSSFFSALCNGYYYLVWILALLGAWALFRTQKARLFYLLPLYLVGLTMAHMLVEVAPRYHYSGLISLSILGAYGLSFLARRSVKCFKNCPLQRRAKGEVDRC